MRDFTRGLNGAANRINRNLQHRLTVQIRFGESKHDAKEKAREEYLKLHGNLIGYNPSKVEGIFSIKTLESYRQTAREFSIWAASQGCCKITQIDRNMVGNYLQQRQLDGKSAWTISKDLSALNKVFNYQLNKSELGLEHRRLKDIRRSRDPTANDKRRFAKYGDQIAFSKAIGCRRQSVTKVKPSDCQRSANGTVVAVMLTEKGGKTRVAPVLNEYKSIVTEIVNRHSNTSDEPLFSSYDSHIDNHAFRSEYSVALLKQLEDERAADKPFCLGDFDAYALVNLSGKDALSDSPFRGHDRDIVAMVSGALGHNRLCIVFQSYIR